MEDSHAEVGDEGRLGQVHLEEYFLGGVGFVQSSGGHDCVSEPRSHRTVYCDTEHLHHLNRVGINIHTLVTNETPRHAFST